MSVHGPRQVRDGYTKTGQPRVKNVWDVRYRDDHGKQPSLKFDDYAAACQFDRDMKTRRYVGDTIDPDRENMALSDYYFGEYVLRYPADHHDWRWLPKRAELRPWHVGHYFGHLPLSRVNRPDVIDPWHRAMRDAGASKATIWRSHALLVAIINHAVANEVLSRSRVNGKAPKYKPRKTKVEPFLPAEIEAIRNDLLQRSMHLPAGGAAGGGAAHWGEARRLDYSFRRRRDAELVSFQGYEGTRPGEALALEWPNLLNAGRTDIATAVKIVNTITGIDEDEDDEETKTGNDRAVPLEPHVRADLREWWLYCGRPKSGLVFPRTPAGESWTPGQFSNWRKAIWVPTLKALGIGWDQKRERCVPPKHMRHSCLSMWIREGKDVGTVSDLAGHSPEICWKHYRLQFKTLDPDDHFNKSEAIAAARGAQSDARSAAI